MKTEKNEIALPVQYVLGGLTKREYFAGLAMQGLLANGSPEILQSDISLARLAVSNADALIEQLNKEQ